MTAHSATPATEVRYCEHCGDEVNEAGTHATVTVCVALCPSCGGLVEDDERWDDRADDRCECARGLRN